MKEKHKKKTVCVFLGYWWNGDVDVVKLFCIFIRLAFELPIVNL